MTVQAGLCWTWSETQIVGFLMHMLNYNRIIVVFLIVLCLGVEFLCCLHLMCVFITLVRVG